MNFRLVINDLDIFVLLFIVPGFKLSQVKRNILVQEIIFEKFDYYFSGRLIAGL